MLLSRCTKRLIMRLYAATTCLQTETYRHATCPSCLPFRFFFPHSPLFLRYLECRGNTNKHNFNTRGNKASHAFLRTHSTTCRQSGLLLNAGTWQKHILCIICGYDAVWKPSGGLETTENIPKRQIGIQKFKKKSHVNACKKWSEAHTGASTASHAACATFDSTRWWLKETEEDTRLCKSTKEFVRSIECAGRGPILI